MPQQSRDQYGKFAAANGGGAAATIHTPATATAPPRITSGPDLHVQAGSAAPGFTTSDTPDPRGSALSIPDGSKDSWAASQSDVLTNRSVGGGRGGMRGTPVTPVTPPNYAARYRSLGLGSHETGIGVRTQQGPGYRGSDVPGTGVPGPADDTAGGMPGAAPAAGDAAGGLAGTIAADLPLAAAAAL